MDIDAESCLKDWDDLAQDYKELEVRGLRVTSKLDEKKKRRREARLGS